ncbi:hypothetical protein [Luteolibacter luteus]|uniref:SH3 domain-containing protein n=1 Tax=Luteolibacter luteus TaxID=2728835 RepID=A0A858RKU9_9BACT|nr:hypothetical protein [Luteolibacter luteus]QJE97365.1 hypothetical protein HHL09_16750 [Luteolibacter luteus]
MKSKAILILAAAAAITGGAFVDLRAQTPAPANSPGTKLAYPYGQECIVTVDPQAARNVPVNAQPEPSGFQPDGTLRGQLIYLSDEWCVLKDGTFENWIPRTKVLTIRASK